MKATKRRFDAYSFYDPTGIALHLEKMAQKGWLIEKITNLGWTYRRIEPKKLHFAVSYYPKASEFDPEPSENQRAFYDFCKHTGWILATSSAQMQVFYNEQENPTPIETDPALEIDTIHRVAKKTFLPVHILLMVMSILDLSLFISRLLSDPIALLSSTSNLFTGFAWTMLLLLCIAELGGYYLWRHKAQKAAEHGDFLKTSGHAELQKFILCVVLVGFAYWAVTLLTTASTLMRVTDLLAILYILTLPLLVNAIKQFLKKKKTPTGVNRTVTMVSNFVLAFVMVGAISFGTLKASQSGAFEPNRQTYEYKGHNLTLYLDELPLTVEDLMDIEYTDGYIRERASDESLLLGQFDMSQCARLDAEHRSEMPELEYTITQVKVPALYNLCKNALVNSKKDEVMSGEVVLANHYDLVDSTPWGALEAYQNF